MVNYNSENYKLYEKKSLETLSNMAEWHHVTVKMKKKMLRAIWRKLNEDVRVGPQKGKGIEEEDKPIDIKKTIETAKKTYERGKNMWEFMSKAIFPLIL